MNVTLHVEVDTILNHQGLKSRLATKTNGRRLISRCKPTIIHGVGCGAVDAVFGDQLSMKISRVLNL